ncbi:hypothetical protein [Pseudomonas sp. RIT-To-2]|uniref:hypothetical protein n=1 Tax=Pseudomonas sp. RIT-To-2 TaxID=3462541 RepID=UPI00241312C1
MEDIKTRSFIAKLFCTTAPYEGAVGWSDSILHGESGWLVVGGAAQPLQLRFEHIETTTENRIHYHIHTHENEYYPRARLGLSLNHYLGLYTVAEVTHHWKLEPLGEWAVGEDIHFYLRDNLGQRVGIYRQSYLNVRAPEAARFKAQIIELL